MNKKHNARAWIACLVTLALVLLANAAAHFLPSGVMKLDATEQGLLDISEETRLFVSDIRTPATISLAADGADVNAWVRETARRVAEINPMVTFREITTEEGRALSGDAELTANSVIVTALRTSVADSADLYPSTYSYNYYTGENTLSSMRYDGERAIAEALEYATREDIQKVYTLTGHGETALPSGVVSALADSGRETFSVDLTAGGEVPADAGAVILYAPTSDIGENEANALIDYISTGGKLALFTNYTKGAWPNMDALTAHYGLESVPGVVMESDEKHVVDAQYPQYIVPDAVDTTIAGFLTDEGLRVTTPLAHAITTTSAVRSAVHIVTLLCTSDTAYRKPDPAVATTLTKEDADEEGAYDVAMLATENEGALLWFASTDMLTDDIDAYAGNANTRLLTNALDALGNPVADSFFAEAEDASKDLSSPRLEFKGNAGTVLIALFIALPLAVFLLCAAALPRRRRHAPKRDS